jgi:hypothetical protein
MNEFKPFEGKNAGRPKGGQPAARPQESPPRINAPWAFPRASLGRSGEAGPVRNIGNRPVSFLPVPSATGRQRRKIPKGLRYRFYYGFIFGLVLIVPSR